MFVSKKQKRSFILITILSVVFFQPVLFSYAGDKTIEIKSSAFENNDTIPKLFTCDGRDISPPIMWDSIPENTQSLALICDDPDAPMGTWVHWVIYNIRPIPKELPAKILSEEKTPFEARQGINDFGKIGYGGPCPPTGTHRYFFKLYALDTKLNLEGKITKEKLLAAMKNHILAQAELIGRYQRQR